jgi:hypothetical protein
MAACAKAEVACQPKLFWVVLLLLATWVSWPAGLVLFAFLLWSGKLEGWRRAALNLWQEAVGASRPRGTWWSPPASGNRAFDEYRSDTLRRLEEEEKEFRQFLTRLRAAKDKAEFDQFMAERRNRSNSSSPTPPAPAHN